ncbi:MAG: hypothetical protein N4A45_13155 [Flavobacteriales bacterium]|jgi:hypothetical protein|nr:hypothetical protein [Flavobacteriales bacterium]
MKTLRLLTLGMIMVAAPLMTKANTPAKKDNLKSKKIIGKHTNDNIQDLRFLKRELRQMLRRNRIRAAERVKVDIMRTMKADLRRDRRKVQRLKDKLDYLNFHHSYRKKQRIRRKIQRLRTQINRQKSILRQMRRLDICHRYDKQRVMRLVNNYIDLHDQSYRNDYRHRDYDYDTYHRPRSDRF